MVLWSFISSKIREVGELKRFLYSVTSGDLFLFSCDAACWSNKNNRGIETFFVQTTVYIYIYMVWIYDTCMYWINKYFLFVYIYIQYIHICFFYPWILSSIIFHESRIVNPSSWFDRPSGPCPTRPRLTGIRWPRCESNVPTSWRCRWWELMQRRCLDFMRFCGFFCWRVESLVEGVLKVLFFF